MNNKSKTNLALLNNELAFTLSDIKEYLKTLSPEEIKNREANSSKPLSIENCKATFPIIFSREKAKLQDAIKLAEADWNHQHILDAKETVQFMVDMGITHDDLLKIDQVSTSKRSKLYRAAFCYYTIELKAKKYNISVVSRLN